MEIKPTMEITETEVTVTKPNKYLNGKIYMISSVNSKKVYIGSTTKSLSQRMSEHKCRYKQYTNNGIGNYVSSFDIMKYSDASIKLLESFPCDNRTQLSSREEKWFNRKDTCNNRRAFLSLSKKKEVKKTYNAIYREKQKSA
jgi:hypothetical protein